MIDVAVLPGFLAAVTVLTAAPGPDNAFIAATAVRHGPRAGVLCAFGMALGMVVHVAASTAGIAALARSAPELLHAVRLLGGGYLAWLAVDAVRAGAPEPGTPPISDRRILTRAMVTNLGNPKVVLFFAAFLPQFVREGHGPVSGQLLLLGLLFLVVGLGIDVVVGYTAGRLGGTLGGGPAGARRRVPLHLVAAGVYAVLAVLLVVDVFAGR